MSRRHDRLVLTLVGHDIRVGLRSLTLSQALWIGLGGGLLLAYAVADVWIGLLVQAASVRADRGIWLVQGPITIASLTGFLGNIVGGLMARRALAPFLRALPISSEDRGRMALIAGAALGAPIVAATVVLLAAAALIVGKPWAIAWGFGEGAVALVAFGAALLARLRIGLREDDVFAATARPVRGPLLFSVGPADRSPMPWAGSWAWGLTAGRIRLTLRLLAPSLVFALAAVLGIGASFGRHEAGPAAAVALMSGLAVFMLTIRYAPLDSPVLRTAPIGFGSAWRRLLRLPMILSAAFFAVPAGAATAAEPSSAVFRVSDGVGLVILDWSYAVFAAYFAASPLGAAFSFFAAVLYALYEASEFSGAVVIGFAALIALLWSRSRRRFEHG